MGNWGCDVTHGPAARYAHPYRSVELNDFPAHEHVLVVEVLNYARPLLDISRNAHDKVARGTGLDGVEVPQAFLITQVCRVFGQATLAVNEACSARPIQSA